MQEISQLGAAFLRIISYMKSILLLQSFNVFIWIIYGGWIGLAGLEAVLSVLGYGAFERRNELTLGLRSVRQIYFLIVKVFG